jgi:predicted DNA-binding transcriptional regulator AlpA
MTEPRLMTGAEVAAYLGLTQASFSKWVADGRAPKRLPGTRRWDRKAIDLYLDKLSGIPPAPLSKEDREEEEWQKWLRDYEARCAAERTVNKPATEARSSKRDNRHR